MPLSLLILVAASLGLLLAWIVVLATGSIRRWMGALAAASGAIFFWALALSVLDLRRFAGMMGTDGIGDPARAAASVGDGLMEMIYAGAAGAGLLFFVALGVWLYSRPALPPPLGPQP